MHTVSARFVFPVSGPPLPEGTVTYVGEKIIAVEPAGTRTPDLDLGNTAILPGFVNPHTHLDLTGARGIIPPTDPDHFTDWLKGVIAYRRTRTPEQVQQDIRNGLNEVLRSGTTLVGDITSGGASYEALATPLAALRAMLFWELIGLSPERFGAALKEWDEKSDLGWDSDHSAMIYPTTNQCRRALSPHAPYSANHSQAVGLLSRSAGVKAIHLAESPGELELLSKKTGPFVSFLSDIGLWQAELFSLSITDFLIMSAANRSPRLYIHCNYLPPDTPFIPNQSVVYCPRTHAAFGHPPHPFREFLARGVRVCLGTDSLASNPDLDILAEARFVRSRYPDFPGDQLLKMITLSGAEALGWADECGSLEPGKSADFVVLPLPDREEADPHDLFLNDDSPPATRRTMFRGQWR